MKKNKFLCFILILITVFTFPVYTYAYDYLENDVIIDFLPGDVDKNDKVNSADARLCLRAAAKLETLTDEQIKAVDFDSTGEINSSTARQILRASAQIETLTVKVKLEQGQNLVVGPLKAPTGWEWNFIPSKAINLDIVTSEYNKSEFHVGSAPDKYVSISSTVSDDYNISFKQIMGWNQKLYKSFNVIMAVS